MSTPRLSVIVVTWNASDTIAACLASLRDSIGLDDTETIVVDNDSDDGTADLVAHAFPWARLIRAGANLGFARANNLAIGQAGGAHILLLNPDVILSDTQVIGRMAQVLTAHPRAGMVGSRLVFRNGAHQVGDAGFRPSTMNMICHGLGLGHLLRGVRTLYLVRPDRYGTGPMEVDWICGACVMLQAAAIAAAGQMDEGFFLYAEDVEWGCRLRAHGFTVLYLPQLRVIHLQGQSENQAVARRGAAISTRWLDSLLGLYVRLNGTRFHAAVRLAFTIGFGLRAAAYRVLAVLRPGRAVQYQGRVTAMRAYAAAAWHHDVRS